MPENNELSEREIEILKLVATGASNKEIAYRLSISPNTVKVHLKNIFAKIGAASRTEAAMYLARTGLIEPEAITLTEESAQVENSLPNVSRMEQSGRITPLWRTLMGVAVVAIVALLATIALIIWRGQAEIPQAVLASPTVPSPRWQVKSGLPTARMGMAVVAYENRVYTIGGESAIGVEGTLERYDPETDQWATLTSKPLPATDIQAGVIGGKLYVPGGQDNSGKVMDQLEIYDPREDSWAVGAPLPAPVSAYALVAFEGKLYLFGGWDGKTVSDKVFEYDPNLDRWSQRAPMPTARRYAGAVVAGGKIYVLGGTDGRQALPANEVYLAERDDGQNNPWQQATPMPSGRYAMGVASVADIIEVIGGLGNEQSTPPSYEYLSQTDTWQEFGSPLTKPWSHIGLVSVGAYLYALGGQFEGAPTSQNQAYQTIFTIAIPLVR